MSKNWKIVLVVIVLLIGLRVALPFAVKYYVNKTLSDLEGFTGSVDDVDLHLYRGAYIIHKLNIKQTGDSIPIPFIDIREIDLSVHWKALFNSSIVGEVILNEPIVNFAIAESPEGEGDKKVSQDGSEEDWTKVLDELIPLKINRFEIQGGTVAFKDFTRQPVVDIKLDSLHIRATNLSSVTDSKQELPATLTAKAISLGGGKLNINSRLNIVKVVPDFDIDLKFERVDLTALNNFIKAYTNTDVERGTFSLYAELVAKDGNMKGYVKPIIENLKIIDWDKEEGGFFQKIWESVVGFTAEVLENQPKDRFATRVPIKGNLNQADIKIWPTVWNVFKNAFIQAFKKNVDHSIDFFQDDK
ncbi:protein of unknown function [Saccharicrinis carchari]|uniref:DUF748 domain-containing protein n=1 Tax=Saccharicrinis carchari TaxID=1168039 RepID=A0A521CFT8_SACCC|nr:DUF748 domain-containing protein [Saccharicrinis carchari]SMO58288.1 protein of unknown function [Saccharicrinis carchari]